MRSRAPVPTSTTSTPTSARGLPVSAAAVPPPASSTAIPPIARQCMPTVIPAVRLSALAAGHACPTLALHDRAPHFTPDAVLVGLPLAGRPLSRLRPHP